MFAYAFVGLGQLLVAPLHLVGEAKKTEPQQDLIQHDEQIKTLAKALSEKVQKKIPTHKNTPQGYRVREQVEKINQFIKNYGLSRSDLTSKQAVIESYEALGKMIDDKNDANQELSVTNNINYKGDILTGVIGLFLGAALLGFSIASIAVPIAFVVGIITLVLSVALLIGATAILVGGCSDKAFVDRVNDFRDYAKDPSKDYPMRSTAFARFFEKVDKEEAKEQVIEQKAEAGVGQPVLIKN